MNTECLVEIQVTPRIFKHDTQDAYVARIRELGLTAYADTEYDAAQKIKGMLATAVQARRNHMELASWLNNSGVKWSWSTHSKDYLAQGDYLVTDNGSVIC